MSDKKVCERCGCEFSRSKGLSKTQWENRRFCSNSCGSKKILIPDSEIIDMYCSQMLSSSEISEKTGISRVHVMRLLAKSGVKKRTLSEGKILSHSKPETKNKLRLARLGKPLSDVAKAKLRERVGSNNAQWSAGISLGPNGYLCFSQSKANGEHAGKALHCVIAEWLYQRKLEDNEVVHHIDGNKLNNNPENLCIITNAEHAIIHIARGNYE